ncbi:immunoglobulin I-set domain protein, partial [Ostertagia ostertagi]
WILTDDDDNTADSSCALTVRLPDKEPKIIKGLGDRTVPVGLPTIWEVETEGSPRTVKWYKNGKELAGAAAAQVKISKIDDNHYVLELTVEPQLTFLKPLKDQEITEGENAEFQPSFAGTKTARDRSDLARYYANKMNRKREEETKYKLVIKNATREDAAEYKVVLTNSAGDADSSAKLTVKKAKPGIPKIIKGLEDQVVAKGASLVFEVKVEGEVDELRWSKDATPITAGANAIIEKIDDKTYRLTIPKADLGDAGHYSVEAINETGKVVLSNSAGECDSSAQLTVTKPNILKMLQGLKDIDVEEGQPIELKVKIEGTPKTVKWYKNGVELAPTDAELKESPETGEYSLVIPQSKKSDGAAYRITLANDRGEIYSGAVAHVKVPKAKEVTTPANFLSPLEDTEVVEGETLTLKCVVAGEPFPTLVWTKDGVELEKDERVTMRVALDGTATLRIRDARKSDFGQYRITAKNDSGTESSSCQVTVKDKGEEPSKPRFIIPLKSCEAEIGEKKEFEVKLRGFPKSPTLLRVKLEASEGIEIRNTSDGACRVRIAKFGKEDVGVYLCVAKNPLGVPAKVDRMSVKVMKALIDVWPQMNTDPSTPVVWSQSRCQRLRQRKKAKSRSLPKDLFDIWTDRGESFTLKCAVQGDPFPEIKWYRNGILVRDSPRTTIETSADGSCTLTVKECTMSDEVSLGKGDMPKLEMGSPPRFIIPLEDQTVLIGGVIDLECKVTGEPMPQVKWSKDGGPIWEDSRYEWDIDEAKVSTISKQLWENYGGSKISATP